MLFAPSGYNDPEANRVNICFSVDDATEEEIRNLDSWVISQVLQDPGKLGMTNWTKEQITQRYVSPLRTNEKGYKSLRAKYNITGRGSCQFWDSDTREQCDPPEADMWVKSVLVPKFQVKGLWVMAKEYGILLEMVHCLVKKEPVVCPF